MSKKRASKPEPTTSLLPSGYADFLVDLKNRVRSAQLKAAVSVNSELIQLYWDIERAIVERQQAAEWGTTVVELIAVDLQKEFPGTAGFSPRNIWRMRAFFLTYTSEDSSQSSVRTSKSASQKIGTVILPQPVAEIPWGHNAVLMEQVQTNTARLWYAKATKEHGWSRAVLVHQIETDLYGRKGKAISNFQKTLPAFTSDLARETMKDPFTFEFLTLAQDHAEAELEHGLITHIQKFLLELGVGFTFVGSQYHLEVGGDDFYLDLLFYHLKLRCFVVFDLKAKPFTPEAVGKMNFYCAVVDDVLRHKSDNKTIGIILCKSKNNIVAEYSLRDIEKPLAISTYVTKLIESLPEEMKKELGTVTVPGKIVPSQKPKKK